MLDLNLFMYFYYCFFFVNIAVICLGKIKLHICIKCVGMHTGEKKVALWGPCPEGGEVALTPKNLPLPIKLSWQIYSLI